MLPEQSISARRWIQVQVIVWAGFVILLYYIHHHNWLEDFARDLPIMAAILWTHILTKVLWVAGFAILGYAVGRAILDLTRISTALDSLEADILFSIATGWGFIGLGAFFLGVLGLLNWVLHVVPAIVLIALTHRYLLRLWRRLREIRYTEKPAHAEIFILLIIITVGLWGLGVNFLPEYGPDAYASHLAAPALYLEEGRITFHPEIGFNSAPQLVQMWFMESLMLIPEGAGLLLMGLCRLLAALAVFALTRRFFSRGAGLAAALIYLLTFEVFRSVTVSSPDSGLNLLLALGIFAVLSYLEKPSRHLAILAGLMFGFACGINYAGLIMVLLVTIVGAAWTLWTRDDAARFATDLGLAAAVLLLVLSPWLIRNLYLFHNPFFPFLSGLFPTNGGPYAAIAADLAVDHRQVLHAISPEHSPNPPAFLLLPFTVAFQGSTQGDPGVGLIGPWTLLTLPLVLLMRRFPKILAAIVALIVLAFIWSWFSGGVLLYRHMLPILALTSLVAGTLLWEGLRLDRIKIQSVLGWIAMGALFAILVSFFTGAGIPSEVRGKMHLLPSDRERFITRFFPVYPVIEELNELLEDEGTIDEVQVYGFNAEQYRWFADFKLIGTRSGYADYDDYRDNTWNPEALHVWLEQLDVDYLIVAPQTFGRDMESDYSQCVPSSMDGWQNYFEQVIYEHPVHVYRLR